MSDIRYTDEEKKTLGVMKMQEGDLSRLQEQTERHHQQLDRMGRQLEELKERARQAAASEGVELPQERRRISPRGSRSRLVLRKALMTSPLKTC